ncbi:MAG: hypothetical protein EZS28_049290 [Streblomastix strix]|uniref:Uncharacterized protein n=1 Tax=Streblomastix strix TaxID=222440 RepID=A0A5J4TBE5_9EUKA|nr:MAG: hypothetical protein EZS28_049290 [Streblomastix strix]
MKMELDKYGGVRPKIWKLLSVGLEMKDGYNMLCSGDSNGYVSFWDVKTQTLIQSFRQHTSDVTQLVVANGGLTVYSSGLDQITNRFDYNVTQYGELKDKTKNKWEDIERRAKIKIEKRKVNKMKEIQTEMNKEIEKSENQQNNEYKKQNEQEDIEIDQDELKEEMKKDKEYNRTIQTIREEV